jgi:hypothetical protein
MVSDAGNGVPSPEMVARLTAAANAIAWKQPTLDVLRPELNGQYSALAETLQSHLKRSYARGKLVLPDLRALGNSSVAVFTDYGGESRAKYRTYSTLVCAMSVTDPFGEKMSKVRQAHGLGDKEIAFKDFRMGQLRRALPEYLAALDLLPGFLFTLAVDRRLGSLFGPDNTNTREVIAAELAKAGIEGLKPHVNEKLLRVLHLAGFLTGLLAHDGQKIFWMSDHDSIAPTKEMHNKLLAVFQSVLGIYARPDCKFPLLGGALPFTERAFKFLDPLSAADIVAGSIDQYLTQRDTVALKDIQVKEGCDQVLQWLAHDGLGLKKMCVIMRPAASGGIEAATLEFGLQNPPPNVTIIPVYT